MENILRETWGNGKTQYMTLLFQTMPLICFQGLYQLQTLYGKVLPHTCSDGNILIQSYLEKPSLKFEWVSNKTCNFDCEMKTSYVNDYGILCNKAGYQPYVQAAILVSTLAGAIVWGKIMDDFGRRIVFVLATSGQLLFAIGLVLSPNLYVFLFCLSCLGFCFAGTVGYTLPMELMTPEKRFIVGMTNTFMWAIGTGWMAVSSYFFKDWKLAMLLQLSPLLFNCIVPFFVHESPRWLLQKGKFDELEKFVNHVNQANGANLSDKEVETLLNQDGINFLEKI